MMPPGPRAQGVCQSNIEGWTAAPPARSMPSTAGASGVLHPGRRLRRTVPARRGREESPTAATTPGRPRA